jgi:hypothetical protein
MGLWALRQGVLKSTALWYNRHRRSTWSIAIPDRNAVLQHVEPVHLMTAVPA